MKFLAVFSFLSVLLACTHSQNPISQGVNPQISGSQGLEKLSESLQQIVTSQSTLSNNISLLRVTTQGMTSSHRALLEQQELNIQNFSTEYQQFTVLISSIDQLNWLANQPFVVRIQMAQPASRR